MNASGTYRERERLLCKPLALAQALPAMGRVMLTAQAGGVTHERMGQVEEVRLEGDFLHVSGDTHAARIDVRAVNAITVDRTIRMKDRILPRIDLVDANRRVMIGIVALDGPALFETAIAHFETGDPMVAEPRPAFGRTSNESDELGSAPFLAAKADGHPVTIEFRQDSVFQSWTGVIDDVKAAMGFINVMKPDFHLHLRNVTISTWNRMTTGDQVGLIGLDASGNDVGLILKGRGRAFSHIRPSN
jgi:hypothetical protein